MRIFLFFLALPFVLVGELFDPVALFLTWQSDPQTTMTVVWITKEKEDEILLQWREAESACWHSINGTTQKMPGDLPYLVHQAEIKDLKPGSDTVFRIGEAGVSRKFRTLPKDLTKAVRFVVGGDIYHDDLELVEKTNRQAAKTNPYFAIQGGDLAYAAARRGEASTNKNLRWIEWLKLWKETMITTDGYVIALIPTIGNHDVNGRFNQTPEQAPFFYTLFPFPGKKGCNVLDSGDYLSLIVLDSHHSHPIYGTQSRWLYQTLEKRKDVQHTFAAYHIPAFPVVHRYNKAISRFIRRYWVPSFEKFQLAAAFENHEHAYKRSLPLKKGKAVPSGTLYLGGGCWGVEKPRKVKRASYLAKALPIRHFILVTLKDDKREFVAITPEGEVFDRF
jgi:hypothetical protein